MRDFFFYFSGVTPSAVRYKNWKCIHHRSLPTGRVMPLIPFHFTPVQNIKRDPFEQNVGIDQAAMSWAVRSRPRPPSCTTGTCCRSASSCGGHLLTYERFPPLQAPESYNLSGILEMVKKANASHAAD
jgi:arylsulfatase